MESGEPDTTVEDSTAEESTAEVSKQRWTVRWRTYDSHIPPINNLYT